jgi:hypothetical protein
MEIRTRFAFWDLSALLGGASPRETAARAHRRRHREAIRNAVPQPPLSGQAANRTLDKPLPLRSE